MIPGQLEPPPARLPLNTRSSDHPGKCASGVGTTGEAKDIYFIPWIELVDNEFITGLNDFFQSQTNGTPEQPLDDTTIVANPVMVENFLQRPIGSFWFNQPLETFLVPGIEFRDVGISLDPSLFQVPSIRMIMRCMSVALATGLITVGFGNQS